MIRTCRKCGKEFEGYKSALYCDECKVLTCHECGKEFTYKHEGALSEALKRGYGFCSRACANAYNAKHRTEEQKRKQTEKMHSPEAREKARKTMLERYGVEYTGQLKDIGFGGDSRRKLTVEEKQRVAEKRRKTMLERYGVEYPIHIPGVKEKVMAALHSPESREKMKRTMAERHSAAGYPESLARAVANAHTEEANRKRGDAIRRHWAEHHDEIMAKRRETIRRKKSEQVSD